MQFLYGPLNYNQLELCHSSTASPCVWQQSTPDVDSLRHDAIAKDAFIHALEDKELTLRVMERAQISRGSLQYCRKDGTLCEEGKARGHGWVRIQDKEPGRTF